MAFAGVTRQYERIIEGQMTELTLDNELGDTALWPTALRIRIRRRGAVRSTTADRDQRQNDEARQPSHSAGIGGTAIAVTSTSTTMSVAGAAGAVAASGMFGSSGGSGSAAIS